MKTINYSIAYYLGVFCNIAYSYSLQGSEVINLTTVLCTDDFWLRHWKNY